MKVCIKSRKGVAILLSAAETLNLMIDFGMLIISLISLMFTIFVYFFDNKK